MTTRLPETPLKELPIAVSAITHDVITSTNTTSALESATYAAGVVVTSTSTGQPSFTIRGFHSDGEGITVNGQQGQPYGGVPIDAVDRVEVLKGPSSILTGVTAFGGGLVNLSLKRPTAETVRDVTLRYGTYNYATIAIDLGGKLSANDGLTYRLVSSYNRADKYQLGYRDPHEYLIMPAIQWQNDRITLAATVRYSEVRSVNRAIFGFRLPDSTIENPRFLILPGNGPGNPEAHVDTSNLNVNLEQTYRAGPIGAFDVTVNNVFQYDWSKYVGTTLPIFPTEGGNSASTLPTFTEARGKNYTNRFSVAFKGLGHHDFITAKLGIDYQQNNSPNVTMLDFRTFVITDTNNPTVPLTGFSNSFENETKFNTYSIYGLLKLDLLSDRLHVLGQTRFDWYSYRNIYPDFISSTSDEVFSYTTGAVFDLTRHLGVYINRSDGRIPKAPILGNVVPPEGRTLTEAGLRQSMFDDRFNITMSAYDLRETDTTIPLFNQPGFPNGVRNITFAGLQSRGIEIEAQGELLSGWSLTGNVTRLWTRSLDDTYPGLDPIAGRSDYQGALWTTYTFERGYLKGLILGGGGRALTSFRVNRSDGVFGTFELPGYVIVDASIGYTGKRLTANLKINNIFDRTTFATSRSDSYLPLERQRNVMLTTGFRF
nr:TonB-dependent receptor plug domain-containing protein [Sphingomonas sp. GM_Shp_2]